MDDSKLLKKVRKKVKRALGVGFLNKRTKRQDVILKELKFMTVGMADVVLADKFKDEEGFLASVNAFIELEQKAYNYNLPQYTVGNMAVINSLIRLKHQVEDFKEMHLQKFKIQE